MRPAKVTVVYGEPLSPEDRSLLQSSNDDKAMAELMRQRVQEAYDSVASEHA